MKHHYDYLIIGYGLVGALARQVLLRLGLNVGVIDKVAHYNYQDIRGIALAQTSIDFINKISLWDKMKLYASSFSKLQFDADCSKLSIMWRSDDFDLANFGWVIGAGDLLKTLHLNQPIDNCYLNANVLRLEFTGDRWHIATKDHQFTATWLLAADGGESIVRKYNKIATTRYDYDQSAVVYKILVCHNCQLDKAWLRFGNGMSIACLPNGNQHLKVVWVVNNPYDPSEHNFNTLKQLFGNAAGIWNKAEDYNVYELNMLKANVLQKNQSILLGNAAITLHPLLAQNLNLAIRDIKCLHDQLNSGQDLNNYEKLRISEHQNIFSVTHNLANIIKRQKNASSFNLGFGLAAFSYSFSEYLIKLGSGL